jgi:ABC-2 type transport system permease protein
MRALIPLTMSNIRSFLRERAAVFWTLAFPFMFILLFGTIFSGRGSPEYKVGWSDQDGTTASVRIRDAFAGVGLLTIVDGSDADLLQQMRDGDLDAVVVLPEGVGAALAAANSSNASRPIPVAVYTDPSRQTTSGTIQQIVAQVLGGVNLALSGREPVLVAEPRALQTEDISAAAYFVPSILAMALMQLGIFGALPLVVERDKLIYKRLSATPLPRWTLVGSHLLMRLLIAVIQTVLIVGIGMAFFQVRILGSPLLIGFIVMLGATTFIGMGYVIASFARSEEAANALASIVQFPLMFLSGIFFPLEIMPDFLQPVAAVMPLTYLGDALRQVMVGGSPFVPLGVGLAVLAAWLVASLAISARWFRWQ